MKNDKMEVYEEISFLRKKYQELKNEFEQYKKRSIEWLVEDFLKGADQMNYMISKDKAKEALEKMIHDATLGKSWVTLGEYITDYGIRHKSRGKLNNIKTK